MQYCDKCGSTEVFFDAWVGVNDSTDVRPFQHTHCGPCGTRTTLVDVMPPQPWEDQTNPMFIPPIVMHPTTGADYDTVTSVVKGWVVQVHLLIPDGQPHVGTVGFLDSNDNSVALFSEDEDFIETIHLRNVRWIQVL
jgi:hypothetical protein